MVAGYIDRSIRDMSIAGAAGAVISTVKDLYRFSEALKRDTLLTEAGKAKLFRTRRAAQLYRSAAVRP
jgi:hypothetical protein